MIAVAARSAASRSAERGLHEHGDPALDRRHGEGDPDEPGLADEDLVGDRHRARPPTSAHMRCGAAHPGRAGRGVGVPTREHDRGGTARRSRPDGPGSPAPARPRRRLAVKTPAAGTAPPGRRDQGEVGRARRLDPARDARGDETLAGPVTLTGTPRWSESPVVSGSPRAMLAHCTAWPDAPFTRLSSAHSDDHPAGAGVDARREVGAVGPEGGLGRRRASRSRPRRAHLRRRRRGSPRTSSVVRAAPVGRA